MELGKRGFGRHAWNRQLGALRRLDVRGIVAVLAQNERVLAAVGEHHKFLAAAAANRAAVCLDHAKLEPKPRKDGAITAFHRHKLAQQVGFVLVEAIPVFHHELARAHEPESRANLIAKLEVNLIDMQR